MEYVHKFSAGPVEMDKMLDEYHQLRKTRRYCAACPNYKKYWSCPEYVFDEALFLKEFKYMYLIAREYEIPREDKQKLFGIQPVADYCTKVMDALKVQSWKNLLELEAEFPGSLALMPGKCHVCDLSGEGCARPKGQKCRHPEFMRFSLESLGFDVDAICKYEIGVLLLWPKEGHLPDKICGVMAMMSNEKIPMDAIKAHFPDAKKSWLRFADSAPEMRNEVHQNVKRQESWTDNMRKQNKELREDPAYQAPKSWIGFKSGALDSGDYVKNRPWGEEVPEEETITEEAEALEVLLEPTVETPPAVPTPEPQRVEAQTDLEEESKYKWLGFKRSVEEGAEDLQKRPIPKFNLPEEVVKEEGEIATEAEDEGLEALEVPIEVQTTQIPAEPLAPEPELISPQPVPEPIPEPIPEPVPEPAPEPEIEDFELPTAGSVANVLSAAIEIAKDVVGDDFFREEPPAIETPGPKSTLATPEAPEEEDDSKYKWLGFKAGSLEEEDTTQKGGWKKNY